MIRHRVGEPVGAMHGETVFFSFHYQDVIDFRANVVRNHSVTKDHNGGFFDASIWESAKKTGDLALKRLINSGVGVSADPKVPVSSRSESAAFSSTSLSSVFFKEVLSHPSSCPCSWSFARGRTAASRPSIQPESPILGAVAKPWPAAFSNRPI